MTSFIRRYTLVRAIRYDGSRASALAVATEFPFDVARSLQHDDVLVVRTRFGLAEIQAGDWLTSDLMTGALRVMTDADFTLIHDSPVSEA